MASWLESLARKILLLAKDYQALRFGKFTWSSGQENNYYFDARLLSLSSKGAALLAEAVVELAQRLKVQAIGGPTISADPIVGAALSLAYMRAYPLCGFLVRSEAKTHGTQQQVEGPLQAGMSVIVLDDVCSSGGSLLRSIEAIEAMGCEVTAVFTILDHHRGGSDELRRRGYRYITLLQADGEGNIHIASQP